MLILLPLMKSACSKMRQLFWYDLGVKDDQCSCIVLVHERYAFALVPDPVYSALTVQQLLHFPHFSFGSQSVFAFGNENITPD